MGAQSGGAQRVRGRGVPHVELGEQVRALVRELALGHDEQRRHVTRQLGVPPHGDPHPVEPVAARVRLVGQRLEVRPDRGQRHPGGAEPLELRVAAVTALGPPQGRLREETLAPAGDQAHAVEVLGVHRPEPHDPPPTTCARIRPCVTAKPATRLSHRKRRQPRLALSHSSSVTSRNGATDTR